MPGAGSGYVKLGQTQPVFPCDAPAPTTATRTASVLPARVLLCFVRDVVAEDGVEREVGRIAARRDGSTESLGHGANVVRRAAAADADEADSEVAGRFGEVRHLEPRADERVE